MTTMIKYVLTITLLLIATTMVAQKAVGSWSGTLSVQGMELETTFNLSEVEGELKATLDMPKGGANGFELDEVTLENDIITLKSGKLQLTYTGTLNGESIKGTYVQAGQEFPLDLVKTVKTKPGDISLPSSEVELAKLAAFEVNNYKYSVEDYFQRPNAYAFQLSPNGVYLSYLKRRADGKRSDLYVKNTKTEKEQLILKEGEDLISGYFWASDERLLYLQDQGGNENFHLFGIDIDGANKLELTPFEDTRVNVLARLKEDKDHMIIQMNRDNKQQEEPYRLNINTGTLEKLYTHKEGDDPVAVYDFDKDGVLRLIYKVVNGVETQILYKVGEEFKELMTVEFGSGFGISRFNYETEYPHDAYVISNLNSDTSQIQLYDLLKNEVIKTVYENDTFDVSSISLSRKRNFELDYVSYNGEKMHVIPMSKEYKKIHKRLKKEFGDKQFFTVDRSDDESIYMVAVTSDRIVGEYYIYDRQKDEVNLLYKILPNLLEEDLSEMKPISFQSRDGVTIHGYITLPKEAKNGAKVPLVVMPHGGPHGVRDNWGFNQEHQLFASRGYATLAINFRISGGYGKEFMNSGFKQIGRKVMDDLEDGIAYVLEQGWVDDSKIAIFGASHGGYAVLRGMTKTPNLYACGVDYVGVSNLNTFMNTIPAYWEKYRQALYAIWYDPNVPEEKVIMEEISPALHTEKIVKPLFVVQGANDPRVNIDEADQIVKNLRKRNVEVPYMVKYDEGHGFQKEENVIELYKTIMGFFAQHLKSSI